MSKRKKKKLPPINHRHVLVLFGILFTVVLFVLSPVFLLSLILLGVVAIEMLMKLRIQWLEMFGFEIGYFFTMVMGFSYGPKIGFIFGIGYVLLHWVYGLLRDPNIINLITVAVMVPLMGLIAGFFPAGPYLVIGMVLTLAYVVTTNVLDALIRKEINPMAFVSPLGQLALNYILFTIVAPFFIHARG